MTTRSKSRKTSRKSRTSRVSSPHRGGKRQRRRPAGEGSMGAGQGREILREADII